MGKRGVKKLTSAQGGPNLKSVLRHEHLKNLALWSTGGDTPIPSLATFFGRRLAADGEAMGIAPDPDLVSCQRCETILQPGFNCNVRIEKASAKKKRIKSNKSNVCLLQNNVVYYCCYRNLKRGTTKGQVKEIYPSKPKTSRLRRPKSKKETTMQEIASNMLSSPEKDKLENNIVVNTPPKPMLTLEREKRIRKSKSKPETVSEMKTVGGSSKRRRSMKERMSETNKTSSRGVNLRYLFTCDLHFGKDLGKKVE